jgi:hypothetical protein
MQRAPLLGQPSPSLSLSLSLSLSSTPSGLQAIDIYGDELELGVREARVQVRN